MNRTRVSRAHDRLDARAWLVAALLLVAVAALALAACSSDDVSAPETSGAPARFTDPEWGVSFDRPAGTSVATDPSKALGTDLLGASDWGVVVYDPTDGEAGGATPAFAVLAVKTGDPSADKPSKAEIEKGLKSLRFAFQRRAQDGGLAMEIVGIERTRLADRPALKVVAVGDKDATSVRLEMYMLITANGMYAVMVSAPDATFDEDTAAFKASLDSLEIVQKN